MKPETYAAEWEVLAALLPDGWQDGARTYGAIRWEKGITDPQVLLRVLLMHVATGLSLKSTVERARAQGLADLSSVALFKRLRNSRRWLAAMSESLFKRSRWERAANVKTSRVIRAIDATTVEEPGARGTDWRVHYSVTVPELTCDFYEVTDPQGGETFQRIPVRKGDLLLGDRGYCHREAVAHVIDRGGDVIVGLNHTSFPLLGPGRQGFDILAHLRQLKGFEPHSWPVRFAVKTGQGAKAKTKFYRGRLCAVRKAEMAAERARAQVRQAKIKKGKRVLDSTLESAGYVFVFTSVKRAELSLREVLELYRARWQIELVFKRLKSLLKLGTLPKHRDDSAEAWIQGKLLTALLIERLAERSRLFSPWGHDEVWRTQASDKPVA